MAGYDREESLRPGIVAEYDEHSATARPEHSGCLDSVGATEFRVRKAHEDYASTAFLDFRYFSTVFMELQELEPRTALGLTNL